MDAQLRHMYLKNNPSYAPIREATLTPAALLKKLQKPRAEEDESVWIAGRLVGVTSNLMRICAEGTELDMHWIEESLPRANEMSQILRVGDLVAFHVYWSDIFENQLSDIPLIFSRDMKLLVPNHADTELKTDLSYLLSLDWMRFLSDVRTFFSERLFVEVRTPTLVPSPGLEPFLESFETHLHLGRDHRRLFLPTSPEFHLKKLLSLGWARIFELKECFRNGECSRHHQPEFLMLEWYRAFSNLDAIREDVKDLINYLCHRWNVEAAPIRERSMSDLFLEQCGFHLTPQTSRDELKTLAQALNVATTSEADGGAESESWDDIFFRIFLEKVEPTLGQRGPEIIFNYPPSQAALARLNDEGWADRFEFYWKGFEIANAFHELNDPNEQRRRFAVDQEVRRNRGRPIVPVDPEFLRALDYGLPPSGGIALGLERLFMALVNEEDLSRVRAFPIHPISLREL